MFICFHSKGIAEMLYPTKAEQSSSQLVGCEIFKFLAQHTPSNKLSNDFKSRVKTALRVGNAISLDLTLCTRRVMGFEKFVVRWTPLKDEEGRTGFIVLSFGAVNTHL
jgi:hypothetical protein